MSYGYSSMGTNPLHTMVPLMSNGTNFLPALSQISGTALLANNMTGLNDNPLDFNNIKKGQQPSGAGPMELEADSDIPLRLDTRSQIQQGNHIRDDLSHDRDRKSVDRHLDDHLHHQHNGATAESAHEKQLSLAMSQNELMFSMSQGFMMMPSMMNMIDPSQVYPMLGQISGTNISPPSPSTVTQSSATDPCDQQQMRPITVSLKEMIACKSCTLFPPSPSAPPPTTRERPPGCRTVFVGGLPEKITEIIIREVFDRCGEITTLRLSKKNFCHIRFVYEASVDSAIYLSGYRIRIENNSDAAYCGRLHVDYAQARDDQYEWECKQRQLQREQRHRERLERDRLRPLSPPPIVHYSEHEAGAVAEKLKQDESFAKAVQILVTWLERGDCNKKNANTFYSMIQSTNSHVRRLQGEKTTYEEELQKSREIYRKQMQSMSVQFTQIEKVFNAAIHKKVWDHFTKAQRKNIDMWKKQSALEELHDEDEMEMSEDERDVQIARKRSKLDNDHLKEENDSLRCQVAAYKSEVDLVKSDLKSDTDIKDQQIKVLQETIRNLQTQLLDNKHKEKDNLTKISDLETKLKQANVKELLLKTKIVEASKTTSSCRESDVDDLEFDTTSQADCGVSSDSLKAQPKKKDVILCGDAAQIVALVSTFLVVHPFGASIDYIWSYVQRAAPNFQQKELEMVLNRYDSLFVEEVTGIGAKIERKWKFCGFNTESGTNNK